MGTLPLASHIQLPERYRVTRHIASGGMASVWEVEDLLLGRVVAVKVLSSHYALDPGARGRFQREARTAARVSDHPNIATIYDIGEHEDDAFIVMEYFAGGTVADRLRAGGQADGQDRRVPRETALRWLREAATGLDVAHAASIVHRDVKPANLLLDANDRLAVGDFGIARLADDTHMTQTGQVLGTAAYLSPEQALGHHATAASDRYALAVVAYELLTGRRPFAGGPPSAQARQHAEMEPARASLAAPELTPAVDAVLARGLAKEPQTRPATASELVSDLERALRAPASADEPLAPTRRITPAMPVPRPLASVPAPQLRQPPAAHDRAVAHDPPERPRRWAPVALVGALAAVVAGIALAVMLGGGGDQTARQGARGEPRATQTPSERARSTATASPAAGAASQQAQQAQQPTTTTAPTTTPATPKTASTDPAVLNDEGYGLIQADRYAEAVAPLQASVAAYRDADRTGETGFAYALYNLGVALNRSGDPGAAIPVLRERLNYANQRDTVRAELRDAQKQAGQKPGKSKDDKSGRGNGE